MEHQLEYILLHFMWSAVFLIHLIDHQYGLQPKFQGFPQYEPRLRHDALQGIHKKQYTIGHFEYPLHFTPKIGMAGCINDIDLHISVMYRYILGKNGDAPLPFQIIAVEDQIYSFFSLVEDFGFLNDPVNQSGLAVVHMCNDGYISYGFHSVKSLQKCKSS